jgi:Domain of unknown function (DUF1877)
MALRNRLDWSFAKQIVVRHFNSVFIMSQSATLYRITENNFKQLKISDNRQDFDIPSIAKSYSCFHGSFMGLEFILSKGQDMKTMELVSEIFNPKQSLGGQDFDNFTPEQITDFFEAGGFIYYLDKTKVSSINQFLVTISESDIHKNYDSKELNENGIYPDVWSDEDFPDSCFNKRHILDDTKELKDIFRQADFDKDYMLVFVG